MRTYSKQWRQSKFRLDQCSSIMGNFVNTNRTSLDFLIHMVTRQEDTNKRAGSQRVSGCNGKLEKSAQNSINTGAMFPHVLSLTSGCHRLCHMNRTHVTLKSGSDIIMLAHPSTQLAPVPKLPTWRQATTLGDRYEKCCHVGQRHFGQTP